MAFIKPNEMVVIPVTDLFHRYNEYPQFVHENFRFEEAIFHAVYGACSIDEQTTPEDLEHTITYGIYEHFGTDISIDFDDRPYINLCTDLTHLLTELLERAGIWTPQYKPKICGESVIRDNIMYFTIYRPG